MTPLYIRTPTVGTGSTPFPGQDLSAFGGATPLPDLISIGGEPVLVQTVTWSTTSFSTQAGMLLLAVSDGVNRRLVGAYALPAGTATKFASGVLEVGLTIPAGFSLIATHSVKDVGGVYTEVFIVPLGGIVR